MSDKDQLAKLYKQNLENDIIIHLSQIKGIELRVAFDIYYSSRLAVQIAEGAFGLDNLDAKYLAEDLIENETYLF